MDNGSLVAVATTRPALHTAAEPRSEGLKGHKAMSVNTIASFPPFELEGNVGQSATRGREGINVNAGTIIFIL